MKLNSNIPSFKALVRKSYFTKNKEDNNEFYNVYVFGIQSCSGKILTFHVMTDNGMVRSRIPISEIYTKIPTNDIPFNFNRITLINLAARKPYFPRLDSIILHAINLIFFARFLKSGNNKTFFRRARC
jgi:hypothetical protein